MGRLLGIVIVFLTGCQSYQYAFQPFIDRQTIDLDFAVATPSKADILFVVDNSSSMFEEQQALRDSVDFMLAALAQRDTSYRIGIVSTDVRGRPQDFWGNLNLPLHPDCETEEVVGQGFGCMGSVGNELDQDIELRRPHDGSFGRLVSAYDPMILDHNNGSGKFDASLYAHLTTDLQTKLFSLFPADVRDTSNPNPYSNGSTGVPFVIDREVIALDACKVCNTLVDPAATPLECDKDHAEYAPCSLVVAEELVKAFFRSNLNGLGTEGIGYEEGIQAALLAVGADGRAATTTQALSYFKSNTRDNALNTYAQICAGGRPRLSNGADCIDGTIVGAAGGVGDPKKSWLREDALLAVMFVSDEQDCSMPNNLWNNATQWEVSAATTSGYPNLPEGTLCYQNDRLHPQSLGGGRFSFDQTRVAPLIEPNFAFDIFAELKNGQAGRVAIGFIGGVDPQGRTLAEARFGAAADCFTQGTGDPSTTCACLTGAGDPMTDPDAGQWCCFTEDGRNCSMTEFGISFSGTPPSDTCDALAGTRYVDFTDQFSRRTYETICRQETGQITPGGPTVNIGFGQALRNFADIATLACFDLQDVRPVRDDPNNVRVLRASKEAADAGAQPTELPMQDSNSSEEGWFYDPNLNQICLTGLDRLIGDVYEISIVVADEVDFTR